jgi:two-component system, NarL family, sensor histidine kinase UhpB
MAVPGGAAGTRHATSGLRSRHRVSLLWLLFAGTAAVMIAAAAVLALSPASIHASITGDELLGLLAGLAIMLALDLLFLRVALSPLRRLTALMGSIDPVRPGRRLGEMPWRGREISHLVRAFDEMLTRLESERRDSARRALAAQEGERLRVARELHDELGQMLTAIALRAESAETEDAGTTLAAITDALQQSVSEVRRIARELRPEALDDLGLVNALIAMCGRLASPGGPWIEREFATDLPPLGSDADIVVYRVAQEALTNAIKHAGATRIVLSLRHSEAAVALSVRDDGRGLAATSEEGAGITGMRERALLLGARFEIGAAPGAHGTEVRLVLAVAPTPAALP